VLLPVLQGQTAPLFGVCVLVLYVYVSRTPEPTQVHIVHDPEKVAIGNGKQQAGWQVAGGHRKKADRGSWVACVLQGA
jgi:hypothetical protein